MKVTKCKLCGQEIKGAALTCCKGTICSNCSGDIFDAEMQPARSLNDVLWCLAETFYRKGKNEKVNFKRVWNENGNLKMVSFEELYKETKGRKK